MQRDFILLNGPWYLYVAELATYGVSNPTKIGISRNPEARMWNLDLGHLPLHLRATYEFQDRAAAQNIETLAIRGFRRFKRYKHLRPCRELVDATYFKVIQKIDGLLSQQRGESEPMVPCL